MQTLETPRLVMRRWRISDTDDLYEYAKSPNVGPPAGWKPHRNRLSTVKIISVFMQLEDMWAIVYRENGKVIGSIGLHDDNRRKMIDAKMLGYALSEDYWGRGIATEASLAVIKYAFEVAGTEILTVYHYPGNERSHRVIEKCGFRYEGALRHASKTNDGVIHDEMSYSLLKSEYFSVLLRQAKDRQRV